jgi:hypothetical protein
VQIERRIKNLSLGPLRVPARSVAAALSRKRRDALRFAQFKRELTRVGIVQTGPFAGLRYGATASWGSPIPLLLGSYEAELHAAVEAAVGRGYETVIDIGCAEGYYAVGMARRLQTALVFAFDIDPDARRLCTEMAIRNDVQNRVSVGGECTPDELQRVSVGRTLIICDCEGFEVDLLKPIEAPVLLDSDVIVELHDFVDPTIKSTIVERFEATHGIEIVAATQRSPDPYPALARLTSDRQSHLVDEHRPLEPYPMEWAVMLAKGT